MATLTLTIPANTGANDARSTGTELRRFAKQFEKAVAHVPDRVSSGASTVVTIDNTGGNLASIVVTSGPYAGNTFLV